MAFDKETGLAIAALMHRLRPDWDQPGCLAAVAKVASLHPADVAMAAIRLCETPEAKTPMALANRDGQHWVEKVARGVLYPPKREEACPKHPGEWPDNCRGCAGDKLAGDASDAANRGGTSHGAADARALLRMATSTLCSHGVEPTHCHEKHDQPEEETDA